jgi:hypothetical protein
MIILTIKIKVRMKKKVAWSSDIKKAVLKDIVFVI